MKMILNLLSLILIPCACLLAQEIGQPPGGPPQMNREVGKQLEQIKIWQMTKDMDLPTEKAEKFFPLYNGYNSQLLNISSERKAAIRALDSLLKDSPDGSYLRKQVQQVMNLDEQLAEEHAKFMQSLEGILSPVEIARYIVFEQKFDREIRERIRLIMQQRMRDRGY